MCTGIFDRHFCGICDPRRGNRKIHPLRNVLFIALAGVLSGCESFVEISDFGKAKRDYFAECLDLSSGIPSHDTFGNVFGMIDPAQFAISFEGWAKSLCEIANYDVISFDGKSIRSSYDKPKGNLALHIMHVWSSKNKICLAQKRCDNKSNEIIAFEELLSILDVRGQIVTADAMHCHKKSAKLISDAGADYVLALKGNEKKLHAYCKDCFDSLGYKIARIEKSEKGHGRDERRVVDFLNISENDNIILKGWENIKSFMRITSTRKDIDGITEEARYYITSLNDIKLASNAVRAHWQIENNLHWMLDVTFSEDKCRVRCKNAGENFAYIRKMAFNILNKNKKDKFSMRRMMKMASYDQDYLSDLMRNL